MGSTTSPQLEEERVDVDVESEKKHEEDQETTSPSALNGNDVEGVEGVAVSTVSSDTDDTNALDPPLTESEKRRDWLLDFFDNNPYIVGMNYFVLFIVVASGAVWFFMITGWHTLCEPKTNCQPRNQVYNVAIHILTGCFSWMVSIVYPWRCAHLLHTIGFSKPFRSNKVGLDLNGQDTDNVFYHLSKCKKLHVLVVLHLNTLFQYANQICRANYPTNAAANTPKGNIFTSAFFGLSFIMAGLGGCLYWKYTSEVRELDKERFGLGPLDTARVTWEQHITPRFRRDTQ
mmetsp:Transcript_28100/g.77282  ORF Transcript_28100/g.77282 Transcript_28100/m.77282 type:complete len:288 (-) Transcript_28100:1658-2521(-)